MSDDILSEMPFYNICNYELVEHLLFESDSVKAEICQNTDFYNIISSVSNNEILKQMKFSYCTDTEFNKQISELGTKVELSVFHANIRSLNKNHRGLCHFLQLLQVDFDVIILSEVWTYNLEFYRNIFKNYTFYYTVPEGTAVGGIGMFVKNTFTCNEIIDLQLPSTPDNRVETLWLEISCSNLKYIVAGIYRHPNNKITDFSTKLENVLLKLSASRTPCIIAGDINIDISKYSNHTETTAYVSNLLVNNFMLAIIMPTRITSKSATLVDHIYYCEGNNCKKDLYLVSGNLWCDLTDHLPNYFILLLLL